MKASQLAIQLIQQKSITPNDNKCQQIINELLILYGFTIVDYSKNGITNTYAYHKNKEQNFPVFCFAGHTDVVDPGDITKWTYDPFSATVVDNILYGRGTADMKSGVAAFVIAAINFVKKYPNHLGTISILLTSDEEGDAEYGTKYVVDELLKINHHIDYCIVAEPSSYKRTVDNVRIGRRGSLTGYFNISGVQGHVAYPNLIENPIHKASEFINNLAKLQLDSGNEYFPSSTLQIVKINSNSNSTNVVPNNIDIIINIRFNNEHSVNSLKKIILQCAKNINSSDLQIKWKLSGMPFLSNGSKLIKATKKVVKNLCNIEPSFDTNGGTSDGRFIAKFNSEILEIGLINESIHKIDENCLLTDIDLLSNIYLNIMQEIIQ